MNLIEIINWRYSTKALKGKIVPEEKMNAILKATLLCPTSSGLHPFHIILIGDKQLKKKMLPIIHNQPVVEQSSHLTVFTTWYSYTPERINQHFSYLNKQRNMPDSTTDDFRKMILLSFEKQTPLEHFNHALKQSNIGLGFALIAAANEKVEFTPKEGFTPDALDELLELKKQGMKTTATLALGYSDEKTSGLVKLKKGREPMSEYVTVNE